MPDIDFDLRSKILTLRPGLGLTKAQEMMQDVAKAYAEVLEDRATLDEGDEWQDFFTFVCADWIFLSAVFRQDNVSFAVFESDYTFIQESEYLSTIEVEKYVDLIDSKAKETAVRLTFSMADALPWLTKRAA